MPKSHTDGRITVVEIPYENRSLYVVLKVETTPIVVEENSRGSRSRAIVPLSLGVGDWIGGWPNWVYCCKRFRLSVTFPKGVSAAFL